MKYLLLLFCLPLSAFKPVQKPTPEEAKNLKPPLTAQLYTEKAKQPIATTGSKTFKKVDTEDKHVTSKTTKSYSAPKDK